MQEDKNVYKKVIKILSLILYIMVIKCLIILHHEICVSCLHILCKTVSVNLNLSCDIWQKTFCTWNMPKLPYPTPTHARAMS